MNDLSRTGIYVGGAALLTVLALVSRPGTVDLEMFSDQGELFFEAITSPDQVAELEVADLNAATSELNLFSVKKHKGVWTIPSHHNYPADARTSMARAAALVIGLRKDKVVSDLVDDHAQFGVIDPADQSAKTEGRGRRFTYKDSGGNVLASIIIGKEVEGAMDQHYARVVEKRRVYQVKIDADLSTRFEDWIERDVLKTGDWDMQKLVFDNYSIDEQRGQIVPGEKLEITKDDASKWVLAGIGAGEETNEERVREATTTLSQLKIVGVRAKPEGMTAALKQGSGVDPRALAARLVPLGFFPVGDGEIKSNEGDLFVMTRKGIRYTLRFGEIVPGSGDAVTSGNTPAKPKEAKPGEQGPQPVDGNHRYLMITAEFDEALLSKPKHPKLTEEQISKRREARVKLDEILNALAQWKGRNEGKNPESLAKLTEGEPPLLKELPKDAWDRAFDYVAESGTVISRGADGAEGGEGDNQDIRADELAKEDELLNSASAWKAYDQQVADGRKEADNLTRRFGPWYYVIDGEAFTKLKPARKDLVKEKAAPKDPKEGQPEQPKAPDEQGR